MPRKPIPYLPDLSCHITSRCIELKQYFKPNIMKSIMENVIIRAQEKYEFMFCGYVIMPNHIHFYIRTVEGGAPLHRIIQYIKSRFAEQYNRKMNRCGHFWNERYKCKITEFTDNPFQCCMNVLTYIGYNPVKACLVNDPRDYRYSSFRAYVEVGYKSRVRIDLHPYYVLLGRTPEERVEKFLVIEKQYRNRKLNRGVRPYIGEHGKFNKTNKI